jgi:hypothetical protein
VTSLASKARAQYTTAPAGPYTGGQVVGGSSVDPTSASYGPVSGGYGANGGASGGYTTSCSGAITATFNWTGIAPAPQSAIVVETSSVFASADCYGYQAHGPPSAACADGMGDTATINTSYPPHDSQEVMSGSVSRTRYTNQGGQTITLTCSPSASAYTPNGTESKADVAYSAAVYPVIISPGGATPDGNGGYVILVGQHCASTLSPPPPGCTYSNYQWSVTGTTFQSWSVGPNASGQAQGMTTLISGPGSLNVAAPSWYWNDLSSGQGNSTTETISCSATVTPPAGEGSAFTVTATQKVNVWTPVWSCTETGGDVQVSIDPNNNPYNYYWLWAGPLAGASSTGGMAWYANVSAPAAPVEFGAGSLFMVQLIIPEMSYTQFPLTEPPTSFVWSTNGQEGLDTSDPYPWVQQPPQYTTYFAGDAPGIPLNNMYSASLGDQFEDYLMYTPPSSAQPVPVAHFVWTTNGNATLPSSGNWAKLDPAGTVTPSGTGSKFLPQNSFPAWMQNNAVANAGWDPDNL